MDSKIEAVLFDLDGTLIDASDVICTAFNAALRKCGLSTVPVAEIKLGIGRPLKELFAEKGTTEQVDLLTEEYKRVFARVAPGRSRLMPGAVELLASLSGKKKLGIVTSRSSRGSAAILNEFGLLDSFSTLVGIEGTPKGKPDPAPVLLALQKLDVPACNSAFVGDTTYDMKAGSCAGSLAIGVTTGSHDREELLTAGASKVVGDLFGVQKLLFRLPHE